MVVWYVNTRHGLPMLSEHPTMRHRSHAAHLLGRTGEVAKEARAPSGVRSQDVILWVAGVVFLIEAIAVAITYMASLPTGYSLVVTANSDGAYWVELPLVAAPVALAAYVLCVAMQRVSARMIDRAGAAVAKSGARSLIGPPSSLARGWVGDSAVVFAGILFFAEAATLLVTFSVSYQYGFSALIVTNDFGEAWIEFPLVLAAIPLAFFVLCLATASLVHLSHRQTGVSLGHVEPVH